MHRLPVQREWRRLQVVMALAMLAATACSDPWAEVRAGMSDAERGRFDRGARAAAPCAACHDLAGTAIKIGPPLRGVGGRTAGAVRGYAYSPVMADSGVVWGQRTLDLFLAAPQSFLPGTRMLSPGVDDTQRADLVFFLLRAGDPPE